MTAGGAPPPGGARGTAPLLEATGLERRYDLAGGRVLRAVDGVDLSLAPGESLGIVGESGCGKSTLARLLLRLVEPSGGRITFEGADITRAPERALRTLRREAGIVFQNPHAALNPRRTILQSVAEPMVVQGGTDAAARRARAAELLREVGLPETFLWRYPHELSGGQKQRACIARALALEPRLLVLDEPTSALDVSVQAQILELLHGIRARLGIATLFISHNLAVVRQVCDRVAVMYLGRVVEEGTAEAIFAAPQHPYARALVAAALPPRPGVLPEVAVAGDPPNAAAIPPGCRYHPRCPDRVAVCTARDPVLLPVPGGTRAACWVAQGVAP